MPLSDEAVIEAFLRFERQIDSLRTSASTLVVRHWDVLEAFDEADLATFVKAATPDLTAVKAAAANVSSAFYSTMLEVAPRALDLEAIATPAPDGPFLALWHALNEGRPYEQAVAAGRSRVESLAFDTVQSTSSALATSSARTPSLSAGTESSRLVRARGARQSRASSTTPPNPPTLVTIGAIAPPFRLPEPVTQLEPSIASASGASYRPGATPATDTTGGNAAMAETTTTTDESTTTTDESTNTNETLGAEGVKALEAFKARARAAERSAKEAQTELERLRQAAMSDTEKAVATAKAEGRKAALAEVSARLVRAEVKAAAAGKVADPDDVAALLGDLNAFVKDDGEVDSKSLASAIDALVKAKPYLAAAGAKPAPLPGGGAKPTTGFSLNDEIRRMAGR